MSSARSETRRETRREIRCGLCGHRFEPSALACHAGCPLGSRCTLICCPNCGYQVVDTRRTRLGGWLARILRIDRREQDRPALRPAAAETIPLSHVLPGREVSVVALREMGGARISRLAAFGIVPGSAIEVLQLRPTPVVRVGETEIALGREILDRIEVAPPSGVRR